MRIEQRSRHTAFSTCGSNFPPTPSEAVQSGCGPSAHPGPLPPSASLTHPAQQCLKNWLCWLRVSQVDLPVLGMTGPVGSPWSALRSRRHEPTGGLGAVPRSQTSGIKNDVLSRPSPGVTGLAGLVFYRRFARFCDRLRKYVAWKTKDEGLTICRLRTWQSALIASHLLRLLGGHFMSALQQLH